jgi:hypothetical protein
MNLHKSRHWLSCDMCRDEATQQKIDTATSNITIGDALSPYKTDVWRRLTPRERLRRSWEMRSRIPDLKALHDSKLFPKP